MGRINAGQERAQPRAQRTMEEDRKIKHILTHMATIERRMAYVQQQLESRGDGTAGNFMRAEVEAYIAALACMRWHRDEVEGLEGPIEALEGLVEQAEKITLQSPQLESAVMQAQKVLSDWGVP